MYSHDIAHYFESYVLRKASHFVVTYTLQKMGFQLVPTPLKWSALDCDCCDFLDCRRCAHSVQSDRM